MKLQIGPQRIWLEDDAGREAACVIFLERDAHTVEIVSTVVSGTLRGQGVAGTLLKALSGELRKRGQRAVPICSYAVEWFARHPEERELLAP